MRSLPLFLVALTLAIAGPSPAVSAQELPEDRIREIAEGALDEVPGLAIAVGRDGEVIWSGAFGRAALEPGRPVTPATRFRVYSVVKPWTAAAGLRLALAGRLDPEAPISVPGFPDKGAPITAYQLATHTSGIRHYEPGEAETDRRCTTVSEAVGFFADDTLLFSPGTDRGYSTWGFVLLGAVIEHATGETFDAVLRREVLEPAGMEGTVHAGAADAAAARAYERVEPGVYRDVTDVTDPSCKWSGGGYLATASDLVRFPLAVLSGLLPPPAIELLFDERPVNRAGGSGPGGSAAVRVDLESGLVVAVAANAGDALSTVSDVADRVAAAVGSR